jgi:hypothetical protein
MKFIHKEIRNKKLNEVKYFTAIQTDPGNDFIHIAINEH